MGSTDDLQMNAILESTRLDIVGLLMRHPEGLPAGQVAKALGSSQNNMAAHCRKLLDAGLVETERRGRENIYRAKAPAVRALMRRIAEKAGLPKN